MLAVPGDIDYQRRRCRSTTQPRPTLHSYESNHLSFDSSSSGVFLRETFNLETTSLCRVNEHRIGAGGNGSKLLLDASHVLHLRRTIRTTCLFLCFATEEATSRRLTAMMMVAFAFCIDRATVLIGRGSGSWHLTQLQPNKVPMTSLVNFKLDCTEYDDVSRFKQ